MDRRTPFSKTDKGPQEIDSRAFGLDASLRQILIMINSNVDVEQSLQKFARLPKKWNASMRLNHRVFS